MKVRKPLLVAAAAAAALWLPVRAAHAGYQYKSSVVPETNGNTTDFGFKQPYKGASFVQLVPSTKTGSGGVTFTLNLTNVDCPTEGNDGSKVGKCGVKASGGVKGHILDLGVRALGAELPGGGILPSAAGIPFDIIQGKTVFEFTKKDTLPGNVFGALTTAVFNQPLGIGLVRLRTPGSVPTDCNTAPPGAGCTDGIVWAMTGILFGSDTSLSCSADSQCAETSTCVGGVCTTESCSTASDCTNSGGDPNVHCDAGQCCNNAQTPGTCP